MNTAFNFPTPKHECTCFTFRLNVVDMSICPIGSLLSEMQSTSKLEVTYENTDVTAHSFVARRIQFS